MPRPDHLGTSAIGLAQLLAWGTSFYLPAVLAQPVADATGWPYGWVVGGLSLGLLTSGLAAIRIGRLIDGSGGRPVLAASAVLLALGLLLMAAAPGLAAYLAAWVVMGVGMGAGLYDAAFSTLGRLRGTAARGAITVVTLWAGFASTVCWPLSAFLVESFGWRATCLIYAALHLVVTLPLYLYALPRGVPPRPAAAATVAAAAGTVPPGRRTVITLLLAAIITTGGAVVAVWSVHVIAILQAGGATLAAAVGLAALVGPAQVGSRLVEMMAGRRNYHPVWTLAFSAGLLATGICLLWFGAVPAAVALIAYGSGTGIWSIARGTVPLALFGSDGYALVIGRIATPNLIVSAAAPILAASLMTSFGAHATLGVLAAAAATNLLAVIVLMAVTRSASAPAATAVVQGRGR